MHSPSVALLRALRICVLESNPASVIKNISARCMAITPTSHRALKAPRARTEFSQSSYRSSRSFCTSLQRLLPKESPPSLAAARRGAKNPHAPRHHDRGPVSKEDTQTDFGKMDILGNMGTPATSVDACVTDGFHLNNGVKTIGGAGLLLLAGEAFEWFPWKSIDTTTASPTKTPVEARIGNLLDPRGVLNVPAGGFGILDLLYPKPDLLIIGTGSRLWMLGKETRSYLVSLGIRVDIMDTANAAAAYNLLATERGVENVGAAFLPVGWKGRP